MRRRGRGRQVLFGAVVALLLAAAVPVVYLAGSDGIDAVRAGNGSEALERGLVALLAAFVPVLALAAYAHWLTVTPPLRADHEPHIPTSIEVWLVGALVAAIVVAGWPVVSYSYEQSTDAFAAADLVAGVGYGLLGLVYVAFALFCVKRYLEWIR